MVLVPEYVFKFNSKSDISLFINKTPFINVSKVNRLIYFELIDKKELQIILERDEVKKVGEDIGEGAIIYRFHDGRILSADIYNRSAELYSSKLDYDLVSGTFRS